MTNEKLKEAEDVLRDIFIDESIKMTSAQRWTLAYALDTLDELLDEDVQDAYHNGGAKK